jgi:hypothetical protein
MNWINLDEAFPIIFLIVLLSVLGEHMPQNAWPRQIGVTAFLAYIAFGVEAWGAPTVTAFSLIVVRAVLAAGLIYGFAGILIPFGIFIYEQIPKPEPELKPEIVIPEEEEEPEPELEPPPPPPPEPTLEEKADAALAKLEKKRAVMKKAKLDAEEEKSLDLKLTQDYLKELDKAVS